MKRLAAVAVLLIAVALAASCEGGGKAAPRPVPPYCPAGYSMVGGVCVVRS